MSNGSVRKALICILVATLGRPVDAEKPAYRNLNPDLGSTHRLRMTPLMLSRFPTPLCVAWNADRTAVRGIDLDGRIMQWPAKPRSRPSVISNTKCDPSSAAISADAKWLAYAEPNGRVTVMDLDSAKTAFADAEHRERTVALCFSPDATQLAGTASDGVVRIWNIPDGKVIERHDTPPGPIQSLVFAPDGRTLAISAFADSVLLLRTDGNPPENDRPPAVPALTRRVSQVAFTPDGQQLIIAGADGSVTVHPLYSDRAPIPLSEHPFATWSIAFDMDGGRMVTGSQDGTIQIWDTNSWQRMQSLKAHEESVIGLLLDTRHGLVAGGMDGRLMLWPPAKQSRGASGIIEGRGASAWVSAFSKDGTQMFVGGAQNRFELWDVSTMILRVNRAGPPTTRCATFSEDGKTLAVGGDDKRILLCDAMTGETLRSLSGHLGAISAVLFCEEDQTLISVCDRGWMKMWDVATGQEKTSEKKHKRQIYCAALSPDNQWLLTGGGFWLGDDPGEIVIWDRKSAKPHGALSGHDLSVWSIVFFPDGERFAASDSTGAVKIWNLQSRSVEQTLSHNTWIRGLAMSPDGETLVVGRGDGSLRLWEVATWTERASFDGHQKFSYFLQYSPDGKTLVSASDDGSVRFWKDHFIDARGTPD